MSNTIIDNQEIMHHIWWDFQNTFGDPDHNTEDIKLAGYEDIARVIEWSKKYPEVIITGCDDYNNSSSILVLIPSFNHGISVVYIPQTTEITNVMFLYPEMQNALIKALKSIKITNNLS